MEDFNDFFHIFLKETKNIFNNLFLFKFIIIFATEIKKGTDYDTERKTIHRVPEASH